MTDATKPQPDPQTSFDAVTRLADRLQDWGQQDEGAINVARCEAVATLYALYIQLVEARITLAETEAQHGAAIERLTADRDAAHGAAIEAAMAVAVEDMRLRNIGHESPPRLAIALATLAHAIDALHTPASQTAVKGGA